MDKTDRRVRRTQKLLGDALIALALAKEYDDITIQEITDRADIGYRTFFRHYSDKDQLLKDVLSKIMVEMRELVGPPPLDFFFDPNGQAADLPENSILFRHVQENHDLYRVLLFSNPDLIKPLKVFAIEEFKVIFRALPEPNIPFDILVNHMVSALIALLRWWLENDMVYSPEEMGGYMFRLIIQPVREMILPASSK
jgi:AcrR family transcriptional regulator